MTNKQSIEMIRNDIKQHRILISRKYEKALRVAIIALKKQIPMKASKYCDSDGEYIMCPYCLCETAIFNGKEQYCTRCGQAIDWKEVSDD